MTVLAQRPICNGGEAPARQGDLERTRDGGTLVHHGEANDAVVSQAELARELDRWSPVLTEEQRRRIDEVLVEVERICESSVQHLGHAATEAEKLTTVGTYPLGAMKPGDDVDAVMVVSERVKLETLATLVRDSLMKHPEASLISLTRPEKPLSSFSVRFRHRGVGVVLILSRRIPDLPVPSLEGIVPETAGIIALETSEKLISSVADLRQLSLLLRFVRVWARQRGIYGDHFGFLGGTAWAICCARICQMNPYLELAQLVASFFWTLTRWDWRAPISLLPPSSQQTSASDPPLVVAGTPHPPGGAGAAPMLVILPAGSGLHAQQYVTTTTMKIMMKELRRGYKAVQQVTHGRAQWVDACAATRFFQRHRHYLEIDFMASCEEVFARWLSWGEQQLRHLVPLIESTSRTIVTVRPWPEKITFKDSKWPQACAFFLGVNLERSVDTAEAGAPKTPKSFDLREPIFRFLEGISAWPEAQEHANKFECLIRHRKLAELEAWLDARERGVEIDSQEPSRSTSLKAAEEGELGVDEAPWSQAPRGVVPSQQTGQYQ